MTETPGTTADDATLGGYFDVHDRPPAFEGPDGHPYTVSPEVEKTGDLRAPYHGYLVFPRWAQTGVGIVGHVESPTLARHRSREDAEQALRALTLVEVQGVLDRAVAGEAESPSGAQPSDADRPSGAQPCDADRPSGAQPRAFELPSGTPPGGEVG